jgi:hypothetical protein
LVTEDGGRHKINGIALADDSHFVAGDDCNRNARLQLENDYAYYTVVIMQRQALKCFIVALVPEGRYGWRDFKNEPKVRVKNRIEEGRITTDIRFAAIDEAIRLNGVFFVLREERAVHWHICCIHSCTRAAVPNGAALGSRMLESMYITVGMVDMISRAKGAFSMQHSLDGQVAIDALEHQAWLAAHSAMHIHRNFPRSCRWTPQVMGGLGWARWYDVVNTRRAIMLLGFLQGNMLDERVCVGAMVHKERTLWPSSDPIMETIYDIRRRLQ